MNRPRHEARGAAAEPVREDAGGYIARIAGRIKAIRIRRGMTRRLLSEHSGISERYLSQIESGRANISVALLWRVAQAMDVDVRELLPECTGCERVPPALLGVLGKLDPSQIDQAVRLIEGHFSPAEEQPRGLALIGLRGAGKSELGRALSRRSGVPFINLVDLVEETSGMDVGELFSLGGQKAYRRHERQALEKAIATTPAAVVEAGGSLVTRAATFRLLLRHFFTVWVKAAPEEHMQRVMAQGDFRPMQGNAGAMDDLKRILREREPEYRSAHVQLDTSGRTVDSCLEELEDHARKHLGWSPAAG